MSYEKKNWGYKYGIFHSDFVSVDRLEIAAGGFSSLHFHTEKYNIFYVESGNLEIYLQPDKDPGFIFRLGENARYRKLLVRPRITHKFTALEETICYEICGVKLHEDDITRFDIGGISLERK